MGWRQTYRCESCKLEATVSGGGDSGFYVTTETRFCSKCNTLDDVCLSLWCKDQLPGLLPQIRIDELLDLEKEFGLCPTCKEPDGKPWSADQPCPKCGGAISPCEGMIEQRI